MASEDPAEDSLMSVQIYLKSHFFCVTVQLLHFNFGDEIVRITDR